MDFVVLGLLMLRPMTLYKLNAAFEKGISLFYSASLGSLQVAVRRLLARSAVACREEPAGGRRRKFYEITPAGRLAFEEWMRGEPTAGRLEVAILSRIYFLGLIEDSNERTRILENMIRAVEQALGELENLQSAVGCQASASGDLAKYSLKTLEYGVMSHRMALDWLSGMLRDSGD